MIRKYLTIIVLMVPLVFALPHQAQAVSWFPLVPCGLNQQPKDSSGVEIPKATHDYTEPCNQCLLIELGSNVIDMTFFAIVPSVGTLMFLVAGFIILFNARNGKAAGVAKGQQIMKDTAIGIAIIMASWLIANFILKSIANPQVASTNWWHVECKTGTLLDITLGATGGGGGTQKYACNSSNQCALDPNGQYTTNACDGKCQAAPPPPPGPPGGKTCVDSTWNLCQAQAPSSGCASSACSQYSPLLQKYSKGSATVEVLKGLLGMENKSCDLNADSGKGAYGLMQLKPETATLFKQKCGVTDSIDAQWLKNHPEESVCLAVEYINSLSAGTCGSSIRNIAAGYNGGAGACNASADCLNTSSCGGGQMMAWECVYDDTAHTVCNADRATGSFKETRSYVMGVLYCINNPGF